MSVVGKINNAAVMAANSELRRQERSSGAAGLLVLVDAEAILRSAVPYIEAEIRATVADEILAAAAKTPCVAANGRTYWMHSFDALAAARVARGTQETPNG